MLGHKMESAATMLLALQVREGTRETLADETIGNSENFNFRQRWEFQLPSKVLAGDLQEKNTSSCHEQ